MDVRPTERFHEALVGQLTDGMIIDLLVLCFGAYPSLDPGEEIPLAVRLGAIGPSMPPRPKRLFGSTLRFLAGTEHEVNSERVRFYMGLPGEDQRYAYLLDDPERDVWYCRARGGWVDEDHGKVRDRVLRLLVAEIKADSPACIRVRDLSGGVGLLGSLDELVPFELVEVNNHLLVASGFCIESTFEGQADVFGSAERLEESGLLALDETDRCEVTVFRDGTTEDVPELPSEAQLRDLLLALPATLALDELDRVDWEELRHAYGPADDVPEMLREVADDRRAAGFGGLDMAVSHQGSRYSVTPFVIPFLGQLLNVRQDLRVEILEYLFQVAVPFDQAFPRMTYDGDSGSTLVRPPLNRLWPVVSDLVEDDSVEVAKWAIKLLSGLPELAEESYSLLRSLASLTGEAEAARLLAVGVIGRHLEYQDALGDMPADVELHLPFALAGILLGDAGLRDEAMSHIDTKNPYLRGEPVWFVTAALSQVEDWPTLGELKKVLNVVEQIGPFDQSDIMSLLRPLVLPNAPAKFSDLGDIAQLYLRSYSKMVTAQGKNRSVGDLNRATGVPGRAVEAYIAGTFDPTI